MARVHCHLALSRLTPRLFGVWKKGGFTVKWIHNNSGQATVEAAFLIPVLCCVLLLLLQPSIYLYDRMVMQAAASDACRLLATKTSAAGDMTDAARAFVQHRLGAVPQTSIFHVHEGACSWDIQLEGDESWGGVSVTITNELRPLPLIDAAGALLGFTNASGNLHIEVSCSQATQPSWVQNSPLGMSPGAWIGAWCS